MGFTKWAVTPGAKPGMGQWTQIMTTAQPYYEEVLESSVHSSMYEAGGDDPLLEGFSEETLGYLEDEVYLGEVSQYNIPQGSAPAWFDFAHVVKEAVHLDPSITTINLVEAWKTKGKKLSAAHRKKISDALKARALLKGHKPKITDTIKGAVHPSLHSYLGSMGHAKKKSALPGTAEMKAIAPLGHYVETKHGKFKVTKHVTGYVYVEGGPGKLVKHSDILKVHAPDGSSAVGHKSVTPSAPIVHQSLSGKQTKKPSPGPGTKEMLAKHPVGTKVLQNGHEYEVVGATTGYVEVKNGPLKKDGSHQKYLKHNEITSAVTGTATTPHTSPVHKPKELDFTVEPGDYATPTVPKIKSNGLPDTTEGLTVKGSLGGSTGAKLVEDASGTKYVMKHGNSKEHVAAEAGANDVYLAAGATIPKHKLTKEGAQLTEFLDGAVTLDKVHGPELTAVHKKLGEHFVLDAVMGNRDVVGPNMANVMVKNGVPYRIDNGASYDFRAQGGKKDFGASVGELASMRDPNINPATAKVFAHLTDTEIHQQALALQKNKAALVAAAPEQYRETLSKRIDDAVEKTKPKLTAADAPWNQPAPAAQTTQAGGAVTISGHTVMAGATTKTAHGEVVGVGDELKQHGVEYKVTKVHPDGKVDAVLTKGDTYSSKVGTEFTSVDLSSVSSISKKVEAPVAAPVSTGLKLNNGGHEVHVGTKLKSGLGTVYEVVGVNANGSIQAKHPNGTVYDPAPGSVKKWTLAEPAPGATTAPAAGPKHKALSGQDLGEGDVVTTPLGSQYKILKVHSDGSADIETLTGYEAGKVSKAVPPGVINVASAQSTGSSAPSGGTAPTSKPTQVVPSVTSTKAIKANHPPGSEIHLPDGTVLKVTGATTGYVYVEGGYQKMYKPSSLAAMGATYGPASGASAGSYAAPANKVLVPGVVGKAKAPIHTGDTLTDPFLGETYTVMGPGLYPGSVKVKAQGGVWKDKEFDFPADSVKKMSNEGQLEPGAPVVTGGSAIANHTTITKKIAEPPTGLPHAYTGTGAVAPAPAHVDPTPAHVKAALGVAAAPGTPSSTGGVKYSQTQKPHVGQPVWLGAEGQPGVVVGQDGAYSIVKMANGDEHHVQHQYLKSFDHATYSAPKVVQAGSHATSPFTPKEGWPTKFVMGENTLHDPTWMAHQNSLVNKVTSVQKSSVVDYTGNITYSKINNHLRFGDSASPKTKKDIANVDAAFAAAVTDRDMIVYRGIGTDTKTGKPLDLKVGQVFTEKGYMSTSVVKGAEFSGSTKFEIMIPKGGNGMYVKSISHYGGEQEFLLARNAQFMVHEIVQVGGVRMVRMELIPTE